MAVSAIRIRVQRQPKTRIRVMPRLIPTDGKNIELQASDTAIEWRTEGADTWQELVPLSEITGPQGTPGNNGANGADGLIQSVVAGTNITVDDTDPAHPIINSTASGSGDLLSTNNLSDVANPDAARDNLGVTAALAALDNVKRDDLTSPTLAMPAIHIKSRVHDIFSVMEVFDNDTQRDEIRSRTSSLDAGPYINAATDYATRRGYNTVHFPFGTYLLTGTRLGLFTKTLILARSNLTLKGDGYNSCIKLANGLSDIANTASNDGSPTKDYRVIGPAADSSSAFDALRINNFQLRDLRIDGNGANNVVAGSVGGQIVDFHRELTRDCGIFPSRSDPCLNPPLLDERRGFWSDRHGVIERYPTLAFARRAFDPGDLAPHGIVAEHDPQISAIR